MERSGVLIDRELLGAQSRELGARIAELEAKAHELAGQPFNLGSPKQIGEILFGKLGAAGDQEDRERRAVDRRGGPGEARRGLPAAEDAAGAPRPVEAEVDLLRQAAGRWPTRTGRVHTHYGQAVAVTGRLSSSEPNLQNIPIRTAEGRRIREAFIAPPGHRIVSADYSQVELRIMAHISGDQRPARRVRQGRGHPPRDRRRGLRRRRSAKSRSEQRRYAKVINFGLIYGMSAFGLASQPRHRARGGQELHPALLRALSGRGGLHGAHARAGQAAGLRRDGVRPPAVAAGDQFAERAAAPGAERAAINAPMQGTAADLIKLAMIAVRRLARGRPARHAADHAGARRTRARSAGRRTRDGASAACRN